MRDPIPFVHAARTAAAHAISLRWARVGRFDLAVPLVMAVAGIHFLPESGERAFGVPFWAAATASIVAVAAVLALAAAGARTHRAERHRFGPLLAGELVARASVAERMLAAEVFGLWCAYDLVYLSNQRLLYDLDVYLGSAGRWLHGGQPYLTSVIARWPDGAAQDFLLYPPPLLPFFGALSELPRGLVVGLWLAGLIGAGYAAFRLLGLGRGASLAMLAFPPLAIGVASGNVANLLFVLFAAGFSRGATLVPNALFKVQAALPALWLVRERRWRPLGAGLLVTCTIVVATLPFVGFGAWADWLAGLGFRERSQELIPDLYGLSPAKSLPFAVYAVTAVAIVVVALLPRGRRGLAALGLASIWASASLWPHGFLFALPALLMLERRATLWLFLGAGALPGAGLWYLFAGGWLAIYAAAPGTEAGQAAPSPVSGTASPPSGSRLPSPRGSAPQARPDAPYASRAPSPARPREPSP